MYQANRVYIKPIECVLSMFFFRYLTLRIEKRSPAKRTKKVTPQNASLLTNLFALGFCHKVSLDSM